ncbi:hypothetical protein PRZ48_012297 [Zasmidium cellare]|uniref:Uncharacterized protein n=1 Tax=Zasmidium cellare TaxID=395010 RepID=A0ABR0E4G4_ZASCE|nr:hypothetical protein PRZ48_012297 [Zasmidium cellare]
MRAALAAATQRRPRRDRSHSLSTVPPAENDEDYLPELAAIAASILYKSPLPSLEGRPIYVLNAAAFPDAFEVDYDSLLAYVLARLPGEDELIAGADYEIVFFAGGTPDNATAEKKSGPSTGWYLQAYHVLSRATRKKLQKLYIVHPRTWVRVLISVFGTIVSPKFRRKIVHVNCLSQLALHLAIEKLLIPPSAYLQDRKAVPDIYAPFVTGRRAFGVKHPLPKNINTGKSRLPRVLRETTSFVLMPSNITTEGLFRIPPHNTLAGVLKEAYDRGQQFVVWKEKGATFVQPGVDSSLIDEVRLEDAYGVHLAASLIKTWYRELREPIFPESCYPQLKEKYEDPNAQVTPEDLVDLILPASNSSPLSPVSREIVTRHLLPLLSSVASHEPENKMNAENLAICFSMCLVCGSNQMEDGKMSSIIKRVLQAAIEVWPQLRTGLGLDSKAFLTDLQPPSDSREYEDPLEDVHPKAIKEADAGEDGEGHRIIMSDADSPLLLSPEGEKPALPPRRSRAASLKNALTPHIPNIDIPSIPRPKIELPALPKRKPAPQYADPPSPYMEDASDAQLVDTSVSQPPRYSTVFDSDGRSIHVADSPSTYVPVDGFGPPRRADFSFVDDEKKRQSLPTPSSETNPHIAVPQRKAVSSSSQKSSPESNKAEPAPLDTSRKSSESSAVLARMAAQQAANNLAQRLTLDAASTSNDPNPINSAPADLVKTPASATSEGEGVFRKPSWPASAARQAPNIQSLAKPIVPVRKTQTVPIITGGDGNLSAPHVPKPRAPSPGLLKRMSSMENSSRVQDNSPPRKTSGNLEPRRLNLKKNSVDDLRRLYEERVTTAQSLQSAARRASSNQ